MKWKNNFNKNNFNKKNIKKIFIKNRKLIAMTSSIGIGIIVLGATSGALANQRRKLIPTTSQFSTDVVKEGSIINAAQVLTLNDFDFTINPQKFKKEETTSGNFVFPNPIESNHISRQSTAAQYWTNQLIISRLSDTDKDFFLRAKNNAPLNIFRKDYNITFQSFANEIEGTLFLKVDLDPKNANDKSLTKQSKTYEIKGFKKATDFQTRINNVTLTSLFLTSSFTRFATYAQLKEEYEKVADADKSKFITDRISFSIDTRIASIDPNSIKLLFTDADQKVRLNYNVKVNTYAATEADLTIRTPVEVTSQVLSRDIPLNFIKVNEVIKTLQFRGTNNRPLRNIKLSDVKFDSLTQMYSNIELFSSDPNVNLNDYLITYNNTTTPLGEGNATNVVFNYNIVYRPDQRQGISYFITGQITIPKANFQP